MYKRVVVPTTAPIELSQLQLGMLAHGVIVDNNTNQWLKIGSRSRFAPPYTMGVVMWLAGVQTEAITLAAPTGVSVAPVIAGEFIAVTFLDAELGDNAGVAINGNRGNYYDRNARTIMLSFASGGIGPAGGFQQRWSYTVPAGRRAQVDSTIVEIIRDAVANADNGAQAILEITPAGGSTAEYFRNFMLNNTLGFAQIIPLGSTGNLQAGDVFSSKTTVAGTGGSVFFGIYAKLTEFDA